jgi:hypothetical protein
MSEAQEPALQKNQADKHSSLFWHVKYFNGLLFGIITNFRSFTFSQKLPKPPLQIEMPKTNFLPPNKKLPCYNQPPI